MKTCDLYVAAFLVAKGYKTDPSKENGRVYFNFSKEAEAAKLLFLAKSADINASTYADTIRSLKQLCSDILRG